MGGKKKPGFVDKTKVVDDCYIQVPFSSDVQTSNREQVGVRDQEPKYRQEISMTGMPRFRTVFIVWLCTLLVMIQWGCAAQPSHLAVDRASLGTIGLVSARYTPAFEFALPAKGWVGGAGRGAVGGMKAFIVLVPSAGVVGAVSAGAMCCTFGALFMHGFLGALWATAALVKGAGYVIVGPFYGATTAETAMTVEGAETGLKSALASMRIQETMRDHVAKAARFRTNIAVTVLDGQGPDSSSDLLTYFPIQKAHVDTVLELRVNRVWLSANESFFAPVRSMIPSNEPRMNPSDELKPDLYRELQINPELTLGMEARGRLIRTADKVVLFDYTWKYEGERHVFAEWAADDARLFEAEFGRAYDTLSEQMVSTIF